MTVQQKTVEVAHPEHRVRYLNHASLVRSVLSGSTDAAAVFYDEFAPLVHRVLVRLLGSRPEVDDLAQETLFTAYQKLSSLNDPASLKSWLYAIAVNCGRDFLRRTKNDLVTSAKTTGEIDVLDPKTVKSGDVPTDSVYRVLDHMSEEERTLLILRFADDCPLPELAQIFDVSLATIKRKLNRARELFEAHVEGTPELKNYVRTLSEEQSP